MLKFLIRRMAEHMHIILCRLLTVLSDMIAK